MQSCSFRAKSGYRFNRLLDESRRHEHHDDGCVKIMSFSDVLWRGSGSTVAGFVSCGSFLRGGEYRIVKNN